MLILMATCRVTWPELWLVVECASREWVVPTYGLAVRANTACVDALTGREVVLCVKSGHVLPRIMTFDTRERLNIRSHACRGRIHGGSSQGENRLGAASETLPTFAVA